VPRTEILFSISDSYVPRSLLVTLTVCAVRPRDYNVDSKSFSKTIPTFVSSSIAKSWRVIRGDLSLFLARRYGRRLAC
jgi:hypothetical protein